MLVKNFFGLVKMTFGLVDVGYSLPEGQAVKLIFFAPWFLKKGTNHGQRVRVITLFPNIFFVLFLYVERFCKRFWKESLILKGSSFA